MYTGDTNMDFLLDTIDYSAAQFHEEFGHRLPVLAKVTQGFLGELKQETFDKDQVIRIHTESRQKRVVMETSHSGTKQSFSIPMTYHAKFCIVHKHGKAGKELSLAEITSKEKLPVTVQFAQKEAITVGNRHMSTSHFPKMQLVKIFDEMYLLGNFVNAGAFTEPVVPIPLYLSQIRLSQIVGIRGQEKVKFKYLLERFAHFAEQLTYDREFGNTDADGQANDNLYEDIDTNQATGQHTGKTKPPKHTPTQIQKTEKVDLPGLPERAPPIAPTNPMTPSTTRHQTPSVQPPALPMRNATLPRANIPISDSQTQQVPSVQYANVIPRGNIRPTVTVPIVTPGADYEPIVVAGGVETRVKPDVNPASDKVHVSGLMIEEVCEWMKYLKLDKYCEKFREQMIDGEILRSLDKGMLSSDFGLSPVESLRLMKFAKEGHIPM